MFQDLNPMVHNNTIIRENGEFLCLTDMWNSAGKDLSKQPAKWAISAQAKELATFLSGILQISEDELFQTLRDGGDASKWAHWQLAMAYAKYLSPEFHTWANTVVRNHMQRQKAVEVPKTPLQMLRFHLEIAEAHDARLRETEAKLLAHETKLESLQASEDARNEAQAKAIEELRALPAPTVEAADKPLRASLNECVRQYGIHKGGGPAAFQEAWNKLYREIKYRHGIDVKARARNPKQKLGPLDIIEQEGLLPQLYAIAIVVLAIPTIKP